MPNQILQVLSSDECVLEQLLSTYDRRRTSSFAEHLIRATKRIHTNNEMMAWTLRHSGKVISLKTLIENDERVKNLELYLERLNGTQGLLKITHYMIINEVNRNYLIIESNFIPGDNLEARMDFRSYRTMNLKTLAEVCDIIQIMHNKEIGHFDIKPNNIIINGNPFLIDVDTIGMINVVPNVAYGSTGYSATEIYFDSERSEKTDAFSIGAIAYEIITGRRIDFAVGANDDFSKYVFNIVHKRVPTPEKYAYCSNALSAIVMSALSPTKEDRPTIEEIKKCFLEETLS